MSEKSLATLIIEGLGGVENVAAVENCMTRLRTVVRDPSKVDKEALAAIKGEVPYLRAMVERLSSLRTLCT